MTILAFGTTYEDAQTRSADRPPMLLNSNMLLNSKVVKVDAVAVGLGFCYVISFEAVL